MKHQILIALMAFIATTQLAAQDNKKETKPPVYNYVIDDPMDHFSMVTDTTVQLKYFPDFYSPTAWKHRDTTFSFECYDARDSILLRIKENSEIRFISLFKRYTDPVHTYKDADGKKKPLPVSSIIQRYDRIGDDQWLHVDYTTNKVQQLKEYRNQVLRSDSLIVVDPNTNKQLVTIFSYYKVEEIK